MFPNEKRELLTGCTEDKTEGWAAQKGGAAGWAQKRAALRIALFSSPVLCAAPAGPP